MRELYLSIAAAEGNIGDIYIRREALRTITAAGVTPFVYTGSMGSSYVDAFCIPPGSFVTSSPLRFLARMTYGTVRRRAVILMAPGPAALGSSLRAILKHFGVALMFSIARLSGSEVLVLGRSVRKANSVSLLAERIIARIANVYLVRDKESVDVIGDYVTFAPDLAFANFGGCSEPCDRSLVAISLRHDRPVNSELLISLIAEIRAEGRDPIFVTQVKEDARQHRILAANLGARHLDWPEGRTHREHEVVLFECYRSCTAAVSDRLHVLILAAREGAIPVIVDINDEQKLHTSLDLFLAPQSISLSSLEPRGELDFSESERLRIENGMKSASEYIETALADVRGVVA